MGATIDEIIDSLKRGQGKRVSDLVKMALEEGTNPQTILEEGFFVRNGTSSREVSKRRGRSTGDFERYQGTGQRCFYSAAL